MGFIPVVMSFFSIFENISTFQAILFIAGLVLLIIEIFAPGFGIAGGSGLILLIIAIALTAQNVAQALIMILILLVLVAIVLFIILRSAKKGKLSKTLILNTASRSEDGYSAATTESSLIGLEGTALTVLRPAGTGEIDGRRLDVVTDGSFIDKGSRIKVIRTEGRRIVVEPVEKND